MVVLHLYSYPSTSLPVWVWHCSVFLIDVTKKITGVHFTTMLCKHKLFLCISAKEFLAYYFQQIKSCRAIFLPSLIYLKPCFHKFYKMSSGLNFHIWNANWPMKTEAKMAANGGQFRTSVSVPYAGLYVSFSLPRDFLHFLTSFLWKYTQNMSSKYRNKFENFKYISTKSNQVTGYIFSRK